MIILGKVRPFLRRPTEAHPQELIIALGKPHNGPDVIDNILCLCPNHHVLFDGGGIYIDDAGIVREFATNKAIGQLRTSPKHPINFEYVRYHRDYYSAST